MEVEITPEMVEAGIGALCLWEEGEDLELVCRSVFEAMTRAAPADWAGRLRPAQTDPPHP